MLWKKYSVLIISLHLSLSNTLCRWLTVGDSTDASPSRTYTLLTSVHNDANDANNYNRVIGIAQVKAFSCAKKEMLIMSLSTDTPKKKCKIHDGSFDGHSLIFNENIYAGKAMMPVYYILIQRKLPWYKTWHVQKHHATPRFSGYCYIPGTIHCQFVHYQYFTA